MFSRSPCKLGMYTFSTDEITDMLPNNLFILKIMCLPESRIESDTQQKTLFVHPDIGSS